MFYPVEGGSVYEIEDNAFGWVFRCWIPPRGYGVNSITGQLQKTDILKRSEIPQEQYWERPTLLKEYATRRRSEKAMQEKNKYYVDEFCEEIRQREWRRRLCGVWFWNYNPEKKHSEIVYITGAHYFYITYWKFQGIYMEYRLTDMKIWYCLRYIETDPDCLGLCYLTKRKLGKCFGFGTLVRMYDGSVKQVQDIKDGELVMGNDSTPRVVSGVTTGREKMYLIKANKGESYTCNESHILSLKWNGVEKPNYKNWGKGDIVNISVKDYLELKKWEKSHLVQYREGWGSHFEENKHEINPYMLGVYLGDGSVNKGDITNTDIEIIDYIYQFAETKNLKIRKHEITYAFSGVERNVNPYREELKRLGVFTRKFIPDEYLKDSYENRMQLLAGIVDTDGYLCRNKEKVPTHYEVTQKNKDFAEQICELARSCGFFASFDIKNATIKKEGAETFRGVYYRININGDLYKIPVKVARRKCLLEKRRKQSLSFGFQVIDIGEGDYYGFSVDKNNLFLLADGTVVHNTALAGCWSYERTSRPPTYQHCGIQSKDDKAAKEFFQKAIIEPWKKLPDFFRPIYDTLKTDDPSELVFKQPARKGSTAMQEDDREEGLASWIDYGSSTEMFYDGAQLSTYVSDEAGKVEKKISIKDRQQIVRYCSEIDMVMLGKQFYTTTVEVDDDAADDHEFQELVMQSNPLNRNKNNRTVSGMYTIFLPAHHGFYFDKYGYPDVKRAEEELLNSWAFLEEENLLRELASAKRKNPMTLQHAFSVDGQSSIFNPMLLQEQLDFLSWGDPLTEMGDLVWEEGKEFWIEDMDKFGNIKTYEDGAAMMRPNALHWVSNPKGKYEKAKGWMPENPNSVIERNGFFHPNQSYAYRCGYDPFRFDKTKKKKRSNAAAFIYQMPDISQNQEFNDTFVLRYSQRPESTKAANMDVLKMLWWCGCQGLFERNVNHWKEHYMQWKCGGFLAYLPGESEPGIYTQSNAGAQSTVQTICNYTEAYINEYIKKVYFKSLIDKRTNGWLAFKVDDTQDFDEPMAAGITLIAVKAKKYRLPNQQLATIESILPYRKAV